MLKKFIMRINFIYDNLGINFRHGDASACIKNGKILSAVEEERLPKLNTVHTFQLIQ